MAGSLIKIAETTSTGSQSSLIVSGIDSTYDVYVVQYYVRPTDNDKDLYVRVTTSGVGDRDSEYDMASKLFRADTTFGNTSVTNGTQWFFNSATPNDSNKFLNATLYLFNFNNSSEYSFVTVESAGWNDSIEDLVGEQGGGVHTVAEANDGIELLWESSSNFASGSKIILYALKK
jgi:hypothetical protein